MRRVPEGAGVLMARTTVKYERNEAGLGWGELLFSMTPPQQLGTGDPFLAAQLLRIRLGAPCVCEGGALSSTNTFASRSDNGVTSRRLGSVPISGGALARWPHVGSYDPGAGGPGPLCGFCGAAYDPIEECPWRHAIRRGGCAAAALRDRVRAGWHGRPGVPPEWVDRRGERRGPMGALSASAGRSAG